MPAHANGQVGNAHQRKHWMKRIKVDFKQPMRKIRRAKKRVIKARKIAPRPVGKLRPIVRPSCIKHSHTLRAGKGFTRNELKLAKITIKEAKQIGISLDKRRMNKSVEAMQTNVDRLKEYRSKVILFPRSKKKKSKGDATEEECKMAQQFKGTIMPIKRTLPVMEEDALVDEKFRKANIFSIQRQERMTARKWGIRKKKAEEAAAEAEVLKKK